MSRDENLFWELLELSDSKLILDNDMCIISYGETEDGDGESQSFDFSPTDLVFLFAEKMDVDVEYV